MNRNGIGWHRTVYFGHLLVADFFVGIPVQQSGILCTHDLDVCPAAMSGLGRTGGLLPFGAAVQKECLYSFVRVG